MQCVTQLRLLVHPSFSPAWLAQPRPVPLQVCPPQPQERRAGEAREGVWKGAHGSSIQAGDPLRSIRREQHVPSGA